MEEIKDPENTKEKIEEPKGIFKGKVSANIKSTKHPEETKEIAERPSREHIRAELQKEIEARKAKDERQDREREISHDIEQEMIIGLCTNEEYCKAISRAHRADCLILLDTQQIVEMCLKFYRKRKRPVENDIMTLLEEKKGKIDEDDFERIEKRLKEDLMYALSQDEDAKWTWKVAPASGTSTDYLIERTIKHFQDNQAWWHGHQIDIAILKSKMAGDYEELHNVISEFRLVTLDDCFEGESLNLYNLYNEKEEPMEWLIKGLIPKGLTIMGGASKVGKSYFMLNLAMMLSQGKKMFGENGFYGEQGPILYLALEDPVRRFRERIRKIDPHAGPDIGKYLSAKFKWDKFNRSGLPDINDWMERVESPKLVVIDVLAKVWDKKSSTGGGGLYAEEYSIYGPLAELAHNWNTSIVVLTHTTKGKAPDVFNEILGGMGTQGPADTLIVLSRAGEGQVRFSIRGKDVAEEHCLFTVSNDGAKWTYAGGIEQVQETHHQQEIYNLLENAGPMKYSDIVKAAREKEIDVSVNSINTMLPKMVRAGKLAQTKSRGEYFCPAAVNAGIAGGLNREKDS